MTEPKIRFKRDDGSAFPDWEEITFDSLYEPLNNNTYSRDCLNYENGEAKNIHYGDILVKFGEICDVQKEELPFVNDGNLVQKYASLQDGDIILADTAEDETVGKAIEMHNVNGENVISGLHTMVCRPRLPFAPKYLGYYMNSSSYHSQLKPYMQGIKVTSIGRKNIAETMISYPSDEKEQKKIADFLSNVDEVIAASEEEVANLEQQKKVVMQKIFSQEVRFKKEDGSEFPDWEKKQLSDIFYKVNERNNGQFDKTKWISVAKMYYQEPDKVTSNNIDTRTYVMRKGDMAFEGHPNSEYKYGRFVVNDIGDGVISELFPIYRHKDEYVLNYWKYAIQIESIMSHIYRKAITSSGASSNKLDDNDFLREYLMIPSLPEQQLIADFLTSYDEAITAAKQELAKWKELKKGLLQQMFV